LFLNKQTHRFHPKNYFQDLSPILFIKKTEIYQCNNNTDGIRMSNKGLCTKFSPLNRISYDLTRGPNSYSSKISENFTRTDRNAIWRYFASIRTTWLCCVLRQFSSNRSQHIYEVTSNWILILFKIKVRLSFRSYRFQLRLEKDLELIVNVQSDKNWDGET
jgi:hypothetical protein